VIGVDGEGWVSKEGGGSVNRKLSREFRCSRGCHGEEVEAEGHTYKLRHTEQMQYAGTAYIQTVIL